MFEGFETRGSVPGRDTKQAAFLRFVAIETYQLL